MVGFKDYVKSKTGAATTKEEMSKLKNDYLKKTSGAAVTESELNNLEKSISEMGSKSSSIPGVSGAAVSENEMKRFKNILGKKKGGISKRQLQIAEDVAESPIFTDKTLIQLRQAAKAVKKSKGGEIVMGKGADYIKDLL
tara:strand:+ start:43 stop:462 length:420 start_codon:yes stop_codon:yes gene_type:complete